MIVDKIVAIDDDRRSLESISLILQQHCEVTCFSSAEEGLEYLRKPNRVSLVLVDVYMKERDGISVLHDIKEANPEISVIVMTAFGSKEVVLQALQNKADDFLEKPFNVEELQQKVARFLRSRVHCATQKEQTQERMRYFVERNFANVSLKDIAEEVCLSDKYIGRLFREKFDCSFREFKLRVKIDKAREMLLNPAHSVQHISRTLGYQNPETFMRIFKRKTGLTPMEFRSRYLDRGASGKASSDGQPAPKLPDFA
ncbi:MAG: response regulator transcription factor [Candidatus Omnitrophica bacterium]|nr:response regulator transcription factor [Candidatus Omnitrophota bacterium]